MGPCYRNGTRGGKACPIHRIVRDHKVGCSVPGFSVCAKLRLADAACYVLKIDSTITIRKGYSCQGGVWIDGVAKFYR